MRVSQLFFAAVGLLSIAPCSDASTSLPNLTSITLSTLFKPINRDNNYITPSTQYIFTSVTTDNVNLIQSCIATNDTCTDCNTNYTNITGGNPLLLGTTYSISLPGVAAYLSSHGLGAGSYNIGMYVQSNSAATNTDLGIPTHRLCLQAAYDGTNVTTLTQSDNGHAELVNTIPVFAYVTNQNTTVTRCPVNADGSFENSPANPCTVLTDPSFINTYGIAVNNTGTIVYITNYALNIITLSYQISACPVNPADGSFFTCSTLTDPSFAKPSGITFNNDGTLAYVVNNSNTVNSVSLCTLAPDGSFTTCNTLTDPSFDEPFEIAINNAGSIAYITNSSNIVSKCPIKPDGTFDTCVPLSDASFLEPIGIALNNSANVAYIVNANANNISQCPIMSDGSFSTCTTVQYIPPFDYPAGVTLNHAETFAYIPADFQVLAQCPVNASGDITSCPSQNIAELSNTTFLAFLYGLN